MENTEFKTFDDLLDEAVKLYDGEIYYSIFEDNHDVFGKSDVELEKKIFGFSVSDKYWK